MLGGHLTVVSEAMMMVGPGLGSEIPVLMVAMVAMMPKMPDWTGLSHARLDWTFCCQDPRQKVWT